VFFHFPRSWVATALAAAAAAFGHAPGHPRVIYRDLPPGVAGTAWAYPPRIVIDKRPRWRWPYEKALCVMAHEYGHLRHRRHSHDRRSLMFPGYNAATCHAWLERYAPAVRK
jgi:hypothetical protein